MGRAGERNGQRFATSLSRVRVVAQSFILHEGSNNCTKYRRLQISHLFMQKMKFYNLRSFWYTLYVCVIDRFM